MKIFFFLSFTFLNESTFLISYFEAKYYLRVIETSNSISNFELVVNYLKVT